MIQSKYNYKNNKIFMGFDSIEINRVSELVWQFFNNMLAFKWKK